MEYIDKRTPEQIMQKQINNQLYYLGHKAQHLEKMNKYYNQVTKFDRLYCDKCEKDILKCAWLKHLECRKHKRHTEKSINDNIENSIDE